MEHASAAEKPFIPVKDSGFDDRNRASETPSLSSFTLNDVRNATRQSNDAERSLGNLELSNTNIQKADGHSHEKPSNQPADGVSSGVSVSDILGNLPPENNRKQIDQLIKQGWSMVPNDQARVGDIVYGGNSEKDSRSSGDKGHFGIVANEGRVLHSSPNGHWREEQMTGSSVEDRQRIHPWAVLRRPQTVEKR